MLPVRVYARRALGIGLCAFALLSVSPGLAQAPEFRAMWASRFDWPNADPATCQATIDQIMSDLAAANFNAVLFQIRGQADVLYPSPYEVWSPLIGGHDPGWNPLAYAIQAAHTRGLEFHAYINTHTCWQSDPPEAHALPANPNHLFYQHCHAASPSHRDWLHWSNPTNPVQFNESHYVWLAPGVPACQAYTRKQIMHVVENYDVDGVHFDRIRTPGTAQPSWDPISRARFLDARTNPEGLDFTHWTADQITRSVSDIYAAVMAVKPYVKVSAAVYPNPFSAAGDQHQDAVAWAQGGAMDLLMPMMYTAGGEGSAWDERLQAWLTLTAGLDVQIVAGHSTSEGTPALIEQIELTRLRAAAGNCVFSAGSFWDWHTYATGVYANPVSTPAMAWKETPALGIISGHVTGPNGSPLADAQVRITGGTYVALSSADGFYSFLRLPPGTYTVTTSYPSYHVLSQPDVVVSAGAVAHVDFTLSAATPPGDYNNDGRVDHGDVAPLLFCLAGPGETFPGEHFCAAGDADGDADVDLADVAAFQQNFGL